MIHCWKLKDVMSLLSSIQIKALFKDIRYILSAIGTLYTTWHNINHLITDDKKYHWKIFPIQFRLVLSKPILCRKQCQTITPLDMMGFFSSKLIQKWFCLFVFFLRLNITELDWFFSMPAVQQLSNHLLKVFCDS